MIDLNRAPFKPQLRCVHCGRSGTDHDPKTNVCPGSAGTVGKKFATLNLPAGKTCGDCVHIERCNAIFGHMPADQTCDFFPIRFREAQ